MYIKFIPKNHKRRNRGARGSYYYNVGCRGDDRGWIKIVQIMAQR
jgi:hypothetical protein